LIDYCFGVTERAVTSTDVLQTTTSALEATAVTTASVYTQPTVISTPSTTPTVGIVSTAATVLTSASIGTIISSVFSQLLFFILTSKTVIDLCWIIATNNRKKEKVIAFKSLLRKYQR